MEESSAAINEVYIKEEPVHDTEVSTSGENLFPVDFRRKAIGINNEPLTTEDTNQSLTGVSFHV